MKRFAVILASAVIIAAAPVVSAEIMSYVAPFDFALSPGGSTLSLDQFDDAGGTLLLEGITLELSALQEADVVVLNDSRTDGGDVYVDLAGEVMASVGGLTATVLIGDTDGPVDIPTKSGPNPGTPGEGYFSLAGSGSDSVSITSSLEEFIGAGTIDMSVDGLGSLVATGGLGTYSLVESIFQASGEATITYEYSVVPEPTTIAMLTLGGLLLVRRRS